ncbi:uncharacterized protein AB675_9293 [Cyphellophora attinorum]|uniref:C2H2-type domain-containing protein n=1 Tax=Cyphellophora attinorum TaxID=1664694 RepID=A0A0N1P203_9EURO|nr:uncharacterized protein AB675_9293 [Phialophora attinorum]KPI41596.1 hypothetical protein AB675_9293 [Phialophora attinorum]
MGSSLDALNAPSSLTQRRQAAATLPAFELPAPPAFPTLSGHKYPPFSHAIHNSSSAVSVGNLLTPPSNSASDSSTTSSAMPTGSTPSSGPPVLPYTPTFFNGASTPGFHTGLTPQAWQPNPLVQRSMFSPPGPGQPLYRPSTNSPSAGGTTLPPPPYDLSHVSAYGMSNGYQSPPGASLASHQQVLSNPMVPIRPPSQQSGHTSMADIIPSKPASAPPLYTNVGPPSQSYPYANGTPVSQSPHSAHAPTRSPPMGQAHHQMPSNDFIRPPYPSYTLPAMTGPVMSNLHSPGAQMSMVGHPGSMLPMGFNSGYSANPHGMYGPPKAQSPAQAAANDRPFRCDSCPQSFHRNHDLKRHKRIHLAVKPFPCNNCDKSFSRKDALKRHRLVKGCGKSDANRDDGVKSESGSDEANEGPVMSMNP